MSSIISFIAEIKEVKSKKTASMDIEYSIRLTTDNPTTLSLGEIPADQTVTVSITT